MKYAKTKIAFTGTNSSGKTTLAMKTTAILKEQHHQLAELVSSQDRKITWADGHFPVNPIAHYGMITNLIHAEVQATLKGDANIVVTDRSVLDLYSIALYDHPNSTLIKDLRGTVLAWASTYTRIYLLEPLPYQEDGKRPSDVFRLSTYGRLIQLLEEVKIPNLVKLARVDILKDIENLLGLKTKNGIFMEDEKWQHIANLTSTAFLIKATRYGSSDQDVWFAPTESKPSFEKRQQIDSLLNLYFGEELRFDLMLAPPSVIHEKTHDPEVFKTFLPSKDKL